LDNNKYPSSSDDDESSLDSDMPGLQLRHADCSSSDNEDSTVSSNTVDNDDDGSVQASIMDTIVMDAFCRKTTVPSPSLINMIPPVSSIVIPNDQDNVKSSVATPVVERTDPVG
jgi:hypothetical protein